MRYDRSCVRAALPGKHGIVVFAMQPVPYEQVAGTTAHDEHPIGHGSSKNVQLAAPQQHRCVETKSTSNATEVRLGMLARSSAVMLDAQSNKKRASFP